MCVSTQMIFEPYAARVRLVAGSLLSADRWQGKLAEFLEHLARLCEAAGPAVIGHIKAVAIFEDGRYWRASVIGTSHPAEFDGNPPGFLNEMQITVNVLVFGLSWAALESLVMNTAAELAHPFDIEVMSIKRGR